MQLRLKLFLCAALAFCAATVVGQNGDRIEFQADSTDTEFIEGGGVIKRYSGNVIARSTDLELKADEAIYNSTLNLTRLYGNASLRDSVRTLYADTLFYYDRLRKAIASGHVRGFERARSILAGHVVYERNLRLLTGTGGVTVRDDSIRSSATGLVMVLNDSTNNGLIAGMPSLVREDKQGSIMTLTASDTLRMYNKERTAEIWNNVVVKKDSMTAHSIRAFYEDIPERLTLIGKPVIENIMHGTGDEDNNPIRISSVVNGDTIYVYLTERALTGVQMIGNAIGTTTATDSIGAIYYRSVLEGRDMRLDMNNNEVSLVTAVGTANSYYMHAATKKGRNMFVNTARGDTIRLFFENGGISNMRILGMNGGDAVGKYYEYTPSKTAADSAKEDAGKKPKPKPKKKKN
jgi:lipopolysaccharide export system protein LptA